jgi:hypothetical protein
MRVIILSSPITQEREALAIIKANPMAVQAAELRVGQASPQVGTISINTRLQREETTEEGESPVNTKVAVATGLNTRIETLEEVAKTTSREEAATRQSIRDSMKKKALQDMIMAEMSGSVVKGKTRKLLSQQI